MQSYQTGTIRNQRFAGNVNLVEQQARGQYSGDQAETWGQTSNCISTVFVKSEIKFPFYKSRKLCAVQGLINKVSVLSLLVDCGSPVTTIRADLWRLVWDSIEPVENEPEDFQGVTRDGLRNLELTKLIMSVGSFRVKHPVLTAEEIAQIYSWKWFSHETQVRYPKLSESYSIRIGARTIHFV